MRKCLVFAALLLVSQLNYIKAQSLFNAPDTVCIRQPVTLTTATTAATYYWGFCSGYLLSSPAGNNLGTDTNFAAPFSIVIEKEGPNYFGFIADTVDNELIRLSFGPSLANTPVSTVIGDLNKTMPEYPTKLFLMKDTTGKWFMFVTGGVDAASSSLARVDFGTSLANTPSSVNFGNFGGLLNRPRGIFVERLNGRYIGFLANKGDNKLIKLEFGTNISFTPTPTDMGSLFGLSGPNDMIPVVENDKWYVFAANNNNTLCRLDFGDSLSLAPNGNTIAVGNNPLSTPSSLTFIRDCGTEHLFVTNLVTNDIARIDFPTIAGPYTGVAYPGVGGLAAPTSITRIYRERDNLYAFVTNSTDTSVSRIVFPQCTTSTVTSSTATNPPTYSYTTPGTYNVYLAINEGLPNMQVECKQIEVLPIPSLDIDKDTIICQGDTITLSVRSFDALSFNWTPDYNISPKRDSFDVNVWPEFGTDYRVVMPYANGCVVDTDVYVDVSKIMADAGPDRVLGDGARTMLGGPMTTEGTQFTYTWLPPQFISNIAVPNPVVNPPYDYTYYLEVRNSFGCIDIDTVVVRVTCNDLNLPNAFSPESTNPVSNRFGLLNRSIVKLNYLRVFDRWGKLVFETTDITKQWDGKVDGTPAPMGVYVWEADGFCLENKRFKRSGNVTLLR